MEKKSLTEERVPGRFTTNPSERVAPGHSNKAAHFKTIEPPQPCLTKCHIELSSLHRTFARYNSVVLTSIQELFQDVLQATQSGEF
jgi:hypothetical protein